MLERLLKNEILATLVFVLVVAVGTVSYLYLPRQQDPTVNLNFMGIMTILPGASATDVERQITVPLERAVSRVSDIRFVRSTSLQNVSNIILRFNEIDQATFDTRVQDIRREVQNTLGDLPADTQVPEVITVSTSNMLPSAMVLVSARESSEYLRRQVHLVEQDLERMAGVDRVGMLGEQKPELHVRFAPEKMLGLGVSPTSLADTVGAYFRDMSAGSLSLGDQEWQVRLAGTTNDPLALERLPLLSAQGEIPLRSVAEVVAAREDARELVRYQGAPAVLLSIFKGADTNLLELVDRVNSYIEERNRRSAATGVQLVLLDDQTGSVRKSLGIMETNALVGLALVICVTWLFLGLRLGLLVGIGLPFILAGSFAVLFALGETLNVVVLLGVVISLGMLVDDAVVVVESIHFRMQRGQAAMQASLDALHETFAPVLTSVLTTISAFLPLMLLPGLLGDFMRVIPLVVVVTLLVSLLECFWMLPTHAVAAGEGRHAGASAVGRARRRATRALRRVYGKLLLKVLRRPWLPLSLALVLGGAAIAALVAGVIRTEFFASDPFRLFYVNVQMAPGTTLDKTLDTLLRVEQVVQAHLRPGEAREVAAYAGQRFTEQEPVIGDEQGQVFVSLNAKGRDEREVDEIIDGMREAVLGIAGPANLSFLRRQSGPPTQKPISLKVRGDDQMEARAAVDHLIDYLRSLPAVSDISDDDARGGMTLTLRLDPDALLRSGLSPEVVTRSLRLYLDGEVAASMEYRGEKIDVRVRSRTRTLNDIDSFLSSTLSIPGGGEIALGQLLYHETGISKARIRHYNLRRAITLEADLDKKLMDTPEALALIQEEWARVADRYPGVDLDFSGEMDDIKESLDALGYMFALGLALIYLILGTQFRSYIQPLLVVSSVPLAFVGVLLGLLLSDNPLSIYTLYGVVALAGIAVNGSIVLISAANAGLERGLDVRQAVFFAARRRVVPILITTLTTMAGLLSLAMGWGGKSLMWGPIATAIVWGLGFSTLLSLLVVPVLYSLAVRKPVTGQQASGLPVTLGVHGRGQRLAAAFRRKILHGAVEPGAQEITEHEELCPAYDAAVQALNNREYELAIRNFQQVADALPDNPTANLSAAQALILFQQHHIGWDIGYFNRARRYLERGVRLSRDHPRAQPLRRAYQELEEQRDDGED